MKAESGGNPYAIGVNTDSGRSLDLGCWQLNSKWQSHISREVAFDCSKATQEAYKIYVAWGNTFNAWSAYKNGSYKNKLN